MPKSPHRMLSRALRSVACCAIVGVCWLLAREASARPLRVLTYNIHHGAGRDGVYDLQRIADVINAANPDLVALQEVEQATTRYPQQHLQLDELAERTGMQGVFGKTLNRLGGEYGNGVLYSGDFDLLRTRNYAMPNPADGEARRVIELRLQFDDEGTTRRLDFFATHMDHTSGTNRQAQVDYINDLVASSATPAILAGDFNFDDQGPAYAKLIEQWTDPTAANPGRPNQIDYVVYRAFDQWSVVQQGRFVVDATTEVASDHYPLMAVLELLPYDADFDDDNDVDGADFLAWQRNVGATGFNRIGDVNRDHVVDNADRLAWASHFGSQAGRGAMAIPEPTSWAFVAWLFLVALGRGHKADESG